MKQMLMDLRIVEYGIRVNIIKVWFDGKRQTRGELAKL